MKSKKSTIFLLSLIMLMALNLQTSYGQNLSNLSDYSVHLGISPPHIESGLSSHPVGYVYVLNKNEVPITSTYDVEISLTSDDPQIASVPEKIILEANSEYATFDIKTGILSGTTTITAELNGKIDFKEIEIGTESTQLPDDMVLELNLPTDKMHVNSEMPFSVYLKTLDGYVIRAPYDVEVIIDYEKTLAIPDSDKLVIKKGDYYAWGILKTNNKVGNTFLRAIQVENQLDTAKSIHVSSTLPTSLSISVFPKLIPAEIDRTVNIFVSLLDSDGNPAVAAHDIPLKFFSNEQNKIGDKLDSMMKEIKPVIKKGEFGFNLKQKIDVFDLVANDLMIGVSSEGYGVATDTFFTAGDTINIESSEINSRGVKIFGLEKIPSNATATIVYQISTIEEDDDDPDVDEDGREIESIDLEERYSKEYGEEKDDDDYLLIYGLDHLSDNEYYPILANDNYHSTDYSQLLSIVSGDESIVKIKNSGKLESGYSYGTATISSTQKSGEVLVSANIKGVGSDSILTKVVNSLQQKEVRLFSPTGSDTILFERDGSFDIFLVALDAQKRPKMLENNSKYLITPTNGLVEIKKDSSFAFANLKSDSFSIADSSTVTLSVTPIGEDADLSLDSSKQFTAQPSSKMLIHLPTDIVNNNQFDNIGVVQIVDLQNNPIIPSHDIRTKIISSNNGILRTISDAVIPAGKSYSSFPINPTGTLGDTLISASAKGVIPSDSKLTSASALTKLKIFTTGLDQEIPVDEQVEVKLYIDDENAESVSGASIQIMTDGNSTVTPDVIRTGPDGGASFTVKALTGPIISLDVIATAEGYVDGQDTITINVDAPENTLSVANLELPEWIGPIIIVALLLIAVLVVLFLRKSKAPIEEEWEEEEI
ncbi:hypothetical protein NsoK4_03120 [Nitrosopumilus sp. K4]|uniref:hypothetical protein n=1 Tax=Nitrosopumilus sp. K4 TaxID=2795383 RepID=UPI001BA7BE26|nr:hypothetical protein [Nitrosopumilus sp. K4]QUC65259.1 hypothetical protein NsoK4_03120 [Nitrosopumilus sp. K4]